MIFSNRLPSPQALIFAGALVAALPCAASQGDIDYRQHTMSAVGGHMQALGDILRGKVPHEAHLSVHAAALESLAKITPKLFPPGSGDGATDALPAIWEDPEDFAQRLEEFREAATGLRTAVENGSDVMTATRKLGQSCRGCHDGYREK